MKSFLLLLAALRLVLLIGSLLIYLLLYFFSFPYAKNPIQHGFYWKKSWCRLCCWILGLKVNIQTPETTFENGSLFISNHINFIDPVIALSQIHAFPVAKSEIEHYPVVGFAAKRTGIIYVDRNNSKSRKAAGEKISKTLNQQISVLVYPEGTISYDRTHLRKFKKGGFYAAQMAKAPVYCMAVFYHHPEGYWKANRSMIRQFIKQFSIPSQEVTIRFSTPFSPADPEETANKSQTWIQDQLDFLSQSVE